jgi:uncharacterized protein (DUF2336 family)
MPSKGQNAALPPVEGNMTREEVLALLEQRAQAAQHELASQTDAGTDVLHYLAQNGAVATRRAVAANPGAAPHTNRHLADDVDDDVRLELARKIARLMPDLGREEAKHLHALTIETMERLAKDQLPHVRAVLAESIKSLDCIPKYIVLTLARDAETMVAAPVLEYSPLLSDTDLIEIIATAKVEEIISAVARRKPVSPDVADAIVASLDIPAIATLLANPDAKVREKAMEDIVEQAEKIEEFQQPLTMRSDLSKRAIWRLASFVGSSLVEQLMMRYGLDEEIKHQLNKEMRARLQEGSQKEATPLDKARKEVAAAIDAGKLDEAFVDKAANAGQRDTVVLSLSALAKVPEAIVRKIIQSGSAKPVIALVWHAGLSMRVAFKIQSFVMKLTASELLPARAGVHFPMTEDEMRWHLSYFDVDL